MMTLQCTPYENRHRDATTSLLDRSGFTHMHLDWSKAAHWMESGRHHVRVVMDDKRLLGVMGISQPLNGTSWVRLLAVDERCNVYRIVPLLWESLQDALYADGVQSVSVLVIHEWLNTVLPTLGFRYLEDVVTMHRSAPDMPALLPHQVRIRNAYLEDIPRIVEIDHSAFAPPWQMSARTIRQAQRQAASSTVALHDGRIIGYQISTRHYTSGHLARLAVVPHMQGQRVGAVLMDQMIRRLRQRGVRSMTVNTQASNVHSQRLYERYFFKRNGFDLPVWQKTL